MFIWKRENASSEPLRQHTVGPGPHGHRAGRPSEGHSHSHWHTHAPRTSITPSGVGPVSPSLASAQLELFPTQVSAPRSGPGSRLPEPCGGRDPRVPVTHALSRNASAAFKQTISCQRAKRGPERKPGLHHVARYGQGRSSPFKPGPRPPGDHSGGDLSWCGPTGPSMTRLTDSISE